MALREDTSSEAPTTSLYRPTPSISPFEKKLDDGNDWERDNNYYGDKHRYLKQ